MSDENTNNQAVDLSILLPTYNESSTIEKMLDAIKTTIPTNIGTEIIVIDDDSPDGTSNTVNSYIKKSKENICFRIHTRKNKRGLASAIIDGITLAQGKFVLVMDSDFAHPPQMIQTMYEKLANNEFEIVIGSRYITGGKFEDWPIHRKFMSRLASTLPKFLLGLNVNDSNSGFFAIRKDLIKNASFEAIGEKILLEILVKTKGVKIKEIPYICKNRKEGDSKFNFLVINNYFKLLRILLTYNRKSS
jgi:dolichol-phosphate mannosyltransferase